MSYEHRNGLACSEIEDSLDDASKVCAEYYKALADCRRFLESALGEVGLLSALGLVEDARNTIIETIGAR